ncbi:Thioredoxin-like fold containing protein, partial [Trema orientale]
VKISSLNGKIVGLYFSASWCTIPLQSFTPHLLEFYQEVASKGDFETRLMEFFDVRVTPTLVIFDSNGNVTTIDGIKIVMEYAIDAYPFTRDIINSLLAKEEEAKKNHFLRFVLTFRSRNYLVSNNGNKVPISELEGKTVALYFWPRDEFTPTLIDVYNKLKAKGEKFEVVSISWYTEQDEEEQFNQEFEMMPWLGPDGKILKSNAIKLIDNYGVEGYPFTPERLVEIEKARRESQTLESLLVPVSKLVGKTILVYFISPWSEVCTRFTPKLIDTYHDIKAKNNAFEVTFVVLSGDLDTFDKLISSVPWLALPLGDPREKPLRYRLKIKSTGFVVIGPSGQTITREPRELINVYGANAYPFTEEHLQHLKEQMDETAKGWPKKLKHGLHAEHEFSLTCHESVYGCNACLETGIGWYFQCEQCYFGLHPKCALKKHEEATDN